MKPILQTICRYSVPLAALALFGALASCATSKTQSMPTATAVDLKKYAGHWHEIFRLPNRFQEDGARAEAHYSLNPDATIKVVNSQTLPNGKKSSIEGTATPVPGSQGSRLKVRFNGFAALAPVPAEGNYWVIQLEPDYSAALVGTPDRKFLWMLARDPKISAMKQAEYVAKARALGFDTSKLWHAKW